MDKKNKISFLNWSNSIFGSIFLTSTIVWICSSCKTENQHKNKKDQDQDQDKQDNISTITYEIDEIDQSAPFRISDNQKLDLDLSNGTTLFFDVLNNQMECGNVEIKLNDQVLAENFFTFENEDKTIKISILPISNQSKSILHIHLIPKWKQKEVHISYAGDDKTNVIIKTISEENSSMIKANIYVKSSTPAPKELNLQQVRLNDSLIDANQYRCDEVDLIKEKDFTTTKKYCLEINGKNIFNGTIEVYAQPKVVFDGTILYAKEDSQISFTKTFSNSFGQKAKLLWNTKWFTKPKNSIITYSFNGRIWFPLEINVNEGKQLFYSNTISIKKGNALFLKINEKIIDLAYFNLSINSTSKIKIKGDVKLCGNISSLIGQNLDKYSCYGLFEGDFDSKTNQYTWLNGISEIDQDYFRLPSSLATEYKDKDLSYCFYHMLAGTKIKSLPNTLFGNLQGTSLYEGLFYGCPNLKDISNFSFPDQIYTSNKISNDAIYAEMFAHCKNLKKLPQLPANKLTTNCYAGMFANCKSLIELSSFQLSAEQLAIGCYNSMFANCSNLTIMPQSLINYLNAIFTKKDYLSSSLYIKNMFENNNALKDNYKKEFEFDTLDFGW